MTDKRTKEDIIKKIFNEGLSQRKIEVIDTFYTKDAIFYDGQSKFPGREKIKALLSDRNESIPDLLYSIEDLIIEDDKACVRWKATGKVLKDFGGFKAGHSAHYWGISIFHFEDGLVSENWVSTTVVDTYADH